MKRTAIGAALAERPLVALLLAAVAALVTVAVTLAAPVTYTSRSVVVVTSEDPRLDVRAAYYGQGVVEGEPHPVLDGLSRVVREAASSGDEADEVVATVVVDTRAVVVDLAGMSARPAAAASSSGRAANAVVDAVTTAAPSDPPVPRTVARLTVRSTAPSSPSSPDPVLAALLAAVVAPTVAVAGALVAQCRAVRRSEGRSR